MPAEAERSLAREEVRTVSSIGPDDALAKARATLASGLLTNEAGVQASVIRPILRELGWDDADPQQWQVEYQVDSGRVDEALLGSLGNPLVFIEAKKQGNLSVKAEDQLFGYAANKGVPILVLTDGDTWDLYLSMAAGEPAERRFAHLTLTEADDLGRVARDFREFIARDAVLSGRGDDAAKARLKQVKDREIGKRGLESAWIELLREPDDMLRDLLIERVEQRVGARPTHEVAERFLRGKIGKHPSDSPPASEPGLGERVAHSQAAPASEESATHAKLKGFEFCGEQYTAPTAKAVMALLADTLVGVDPNFLECWVRQGKSNALNPRALRTGHSRLKHPKAYGAYAQLPNHTDWHLFTGVNQAIMLDWMQDMAEVAGLVRNRDVRPILS